MIISSVETLTKGGSDHLPILVTATYGPVPVIEPDATTSTNATQ